MDNVPCTYRVTVKAVIKDGDKILLVQHHGHGWELPGGGLEHGELPPDGLAREIEEEIGCHVEEVVEKPHAFWTLNKDVGRPGLLWFGFIAYEVRISGKFRPSDEAEEINYFNLDEIKQLKLHPNTEGYFLK